MVTCFHLAAQNVGEIASNRALTCSCSVIVLIVYGLWTKVDWLMDKGITVCSVKKIVCEPYPICDQICGNYQVCG